MYKFNLKNLYALKCSAFQCCLRSSSAAQFHSKPVIAIRREDNVVSIFYTTLLCFNVCFSSTRYYYIYFLFSVIV